MRYYNFLPPCLREKMEMLKLFGFKKVLFAVATTILECLFIFLVLYSLIAVTVRYPILGTVLFSIIALLVMTVFGLIAWKKRKNKEYDSKEEII